VSADAHTQRAPEAMTIEVSSTTQVDAHGDREAGHEERRKDGPGANGNAAQQKGRCNDFRGTDEHRVEARQRVRENAVVVNGSAEGAQVTQLEDPRYTEPQYEHETTCRHQFHCYLHKGTRVADAISNRLTL
jgi:hypothetical protein